MADGALQDRQLMAQRDVLDGDACRPKDEGAEEESNTEQEDHRDSGATCRKMRPR